MEVPAGECEVVITRGAGRFWDTMLAFRGELSEKDVFGVKKVL